jgi:predicted CoA-binding protein
VSDDTAPYGPSDQELRSILGDSKTIAVVGLSSNPDRPSNEVAEFLQSKGYRIVPVNPKETEVLGERAYPSLLDVPEEIRIDVVDVFRRAEQTPAIAEEAVARGAKVLWLQEGIANDDARRIGEAGGLSVVMGVCMRKQSQRLEHVEGET